MTKEYKYMVRTYCATYNQENFITKTMMGFVMQQTDFPVVNIIIDDASTDHTAQVIWQFVKDNFQFQNPVVAYEKDYDYGRVIYAQHKENQNCFFAVVCLKENHYQQQKSKRPYVQQWEDQAKYWTYCEGDDFWTDPMRIQKQVDFLESHPDYNLVCHNWNILQDGVILPSPVHDLYKEPFSFTFATLPWVWITKTLTIMYRKDAINYDSIIKFKYGRDVHLVYYALKDSKGYFMPEVMATYRVVDSGVWSKVDSNKKNFTTYALYKELYQYEPNKAVRKRYMNATLAYFNGLAYGKKTWWHIGTNAKLYFEALGHISDAKDLVFCLGGLVPTKAVKWVMKRFKV